MSVQQNLSANYGIGSYRYDVSYENYMIQGQLNRHDIFGYTKLNSQTASTFLGLINDSTEYNGMKGKALVDAF